MKPIVDALMLPPGPDGKAHPDFKAYSNPYAAEWMPDQWDLFPIYSDENTILPDAARSIAWLWQEYNLKNDGCLDCADDQMRAWDEAARGNPAYVKLPIVEYKS